MIETTKETCILCSPQSQSLRDTPTRNELAIKMFALGLTLPAITTNPHAMCCRACVEAIGKESAAILFVASEMISDAFRAEVPRG